MDTKAAVFALMTIWGVGACASVPAMAQDADPAAEEGEASEANPLLNRIWVKQGSDTDMPGVMHIFLSDGTLVSDSCWETYRLSKWEQLSDTEISWDEDGMTISADIMSVTADELVLNLKLVGGAEEQRFAPAEVPYVCPDLPR
ncbi:hypothetical protein SAMN06295905_1653 [Devosia lucknowensis]|uniref:Uncharacterized protein n=1 Tax=Devosia lucknowensis TaxID=1096929 RepID=A0A1Y6F5E0_9HYPH|nr:hypothetical protein [Devosia lucknowensis]SMQ68761.1 hypothetical protein SAMN06295905_1653 [Devosia lucknowensis]